MYKIGQNPEFTKVCRKLIKINNKYIIFVKTYQKIRRKSPGDPKTDKFYKKIPIFCKKLAKNHKRS